MSTTTLNLYWDLASLDVKTRQQATVTLIRTLADFQQQHEKSLDSMDDNGIADTEEKLDILCASDVSYAVRRLLRGLPSSRQGARQGFSLALTELLSIIDCIGTNLVLDLLCQYTERTNGMSGEEVRDMLFGRLFGIMAIVASGLLTRSSSTSVDDVLRILDLVSEIANAKTYLNEVCYHVIINMLPHVNKMEKKDQVMDKIMTLFLRESIANVDEVNLTLAIQQQVSDVDLSRAFKGWASQNVFDRANLPHVALIVREVPIENNDNQVDWTPQLHSIWDRLLAPLLSMENNNNKMNASFHEFWSIVVDANMFGNQASHGRKYWGFQIVNKVLPQLSTDQMPLIFTENFMRTFINNLSSEVRFLNKAARQTAITIQKVAEQNKQVGFAMVSQLIGKYGNHQFDRITKTKTVENLLATMDATGIRHYLGYLARLFVNNNATSDDTHHQRPIVEIQREWALQQMLLLVHHPKTPKDETWIKDIIQFFLVYTFFDVNNDESNNKKKAKKSKKDTTEVDYFVEYQCPSPALSEATRSICKSKFQALVLALSKLPPSKKVETGHLKTRRWNGATNDGQLWAEIVYQQYQHLLKKNNKKSTNTLTLHHQHQKEEEEEDSDKVIKETLKVIEGLKQQVKDGEENVAYGFEILFYHVLLHSLMDQEEGVGLLGDLLNCYEKLAQDIKNKNKKNAKVEQQDQEPEAIEVIVDILLSFLTSASPMLKGISEYVFELFSHLLTKQAMENLINIVITDENKQGGEELFGAEDDDEEEEDDDDVEMIDGDDDDVMEEDEDDDEEEDEDDDEENGEVDEELRQKLEEAMRNQGILGDNSDDEELLDDEAMEAFDEKLAEIFRQKKVEKQNKKNMQESVVHFKNNVMDLIVLFARRNPTNPLVLDTIVPLLQVVQTTPSKASVAQFVNKVESYLKNKLGKATEVPVYGSYDDSVLLDIVNSIHAFSVSTHGAGKAHGDMCSQLLLFLRRCIVGSGSDISVNVLNSDKKTKQQGRVLAHYMERYQASLVSFLAKKSNPLHTSFFVTFLQRYPLTCWDSFLPSLLPFIQSEACANTFRHSLACQWSGILIQQCVTKKNKEIDQAFLKTILPTWMTQIQQAIKKITTSTDVNTQISSNNERLKSLMKLASLMDKTASRLGNKITTWDTDLFTTLSTDKTWATPVVRTTCKAILDRS
ncbi:DNA polymerase phi-domain-containing protein [Halteromyces radiatus]|uniref:DNA polymerase phi-domain-containing protein n=1 Tax=Halteromyces radiatus TaxID=101107 RepID=UPI002220C933|nr:DNA polymerase phi-domain-containing protein [Halteromyces radiatus]KAI8080065.1 DNA polymerase phi-domain-containing protein [Halteromyces radiatus]